MPNHVTTTCTASQANGTSPASLCCPHTRALPHPHALLRLDPPHAPRHLFRPPACPPAARRRSHQRLCTSSRARSSCALFLLHHLELSSAASSAACRWATMARWAGRRRCGERPLRPKSATPYAPCSRAQRRHVVRGARLRMAALHAPLRSRRPPSHRRRLGLLRRCWPGGETRRGCLLLLGAWAQAALRLAQRAGLPRARRMRPCVGSSRRGARGRSGSSEA